MTAPASARCPYCTPPGSVFLTAAQVTEIGAAWREHDRLVSGRTLHGLHIALRAANLLPAPPRPPALAADEETVR